MGDEEEYVDDGEAEADNAADLKITGERTALPPHKNCFMSLLNMLTLL